ncbi:hypothetical protein GCM10020220_085940 [Nonomuraea rubra]
MAPSLEMLMDAVGFQGANSKEIEWEPLGGAWDAIQDQVNDALTPGLPELRREMPPAVVRVVH